MHSELVDRLNAINIIYRGTLPGSRGTATLFLGDTRIATNVRLFDMRKGASAPAFRLPCAQPRAEEEGKVWLVRLGE